MNNYQFCARVAAELCPAGDATVLDYGCGAGQIVDELTGLGIRAFGCDVFYEGGDYSSDIAPGKLGVTIFPMRDGAIPFPAQHFDCVVSNQVLEHVEDLDAVLDEIARVLKPGGSFLAVFPDRGVWREGHCGIPFSHWFRGNSRAQVAYLAFFRALGFGYNKGEKSVIGWSRDFARWLARWTHYRPFPVIQQSLTCRFSEVKHIEEYWLARRLDRHASLAAAVPAFVRRWVVRKVAGPIVVCRKPP